LGRNCSEQIIIKEYFNDQLSTDLKLRDGLYFTGDFGFIDDEGYFLLNRGEKI
jgi:acyl-coenzyme A synthetase/AMP-(fatty) acid ligase